MKLIETEFDKTYEELSKLNEAVEQLNFSTLRERLAADPSLWDDVKSIIKQINFEGSEAKLFWTYQFQLLYNAYITELDALNKINSEEIHSIISQWIAKASESIRDRRLARTYLFNDNPNNHDVLSAVSNKRNTSENASWVDIIASPLDLPEGVNEADIIKNIEVKATKDDPAAIKNTHRAEIVFVYLLDTAQLIIQYRGRLGKWPPRTICKLDCSDVVDECISVTEAAYISPYKKESKEQK